MIDLIDATVAAVFSKLTSNPELTALSSVTEHLLQDMLQSGPITRIGKTEAVPEGGKGQQLELVTIDLETIYRGTSPAAVRAIMFAQRQALEGQALASAGVEFDTPEWAGGMVDGPARDGLTYAGIQTFTIFAQPA